MKVTVLILALNEAECLPIILPQINKAWAAQWILVDGGSTDDTVKIAESLGFETYVQQQPGIRHAYQEAIPLCTGDVILAMSPDGNCDVSRIPNLAGMAFHSWIAGYADFDLGKLDLAIGSRYKGTTSDDDDLLTAIGNWCFRWAIRLLHGGRLTDPMVIYRAFRKDLFYELDLHKEESYSLYERLFGTVISIEPLMTIRALKAKKRIMEIGVGEPARIGGVRKLQVWRWGAAYMLQTIVEVFKWKPKN